MIDLLGNPLVLFLLMIVGLGLIFWDARREKISRAGLRETQILFNSAIQPASEAIKPVCEFIIHEGMREHPAESMKILIGYVHRGVMEPEQNAFGKLTRLMRGIDKIDDAGLQDSIGQHWNEYRLERIFISEGAKITKEAGKNLSKQTSFKTWLRSDKYLVENLREYCARPENERLRATMDSNGWNDNVTEALHALNMDYRHERVAEDDTIPIAHNMTMTEAFELLNEKIGYPKFEDGFYQALFDGKVLAWGRRQLNRIDADELGPYQIIEQDYWLTGRCEWITTGPGGTERSEHKDELDYTRIRFNAEQVRKLAQDLTKQKSV